MSDSSVHSSACYIRSIQKFTFRFLGSEDASHTRQQLSTSAAAHSVCSLHHISIIIDALFSYLKILCPNVHRCVRHCDSSEKPVVARNMNPGLVASAISTLLLMHNHWTTASRHSLARLFRHVTEEMCHLDSMYSCQCAVSIEDCGWPINQILTSSIFRLNSR